jgi:hypothetical protein
MSKLHEHPILGEPHIFEFLTKNLHPRNLGVFLNGNEQDQLPN